MAEYADLLKLLKGEQDQENPMMSVGEPASIDEVNKQAKSPYQQEAPEITPEQVLDMPKMQQDIADYSSDLNKSAQEAKLKDTYGAIPDEPELSPQEKLIKELRSIQENKSKEAKTAQEEANKRALLANAIKALGTIGQAQIQRSAGIPIGLKAAEMTAARDVSSPILKERDAMLKQMMDEYKMLNQPKGVAELSPYQKMNLDLQKQRIDLLKEKEGRLTEKDKLQEEIKSRLSDKEVKDITALDDGRRILDEVEGLLKQTDVEKDLGPYASRIEDYSSMIPFMERDPNFVKMQQLVGINLADYVKSISGAQVSEQEAQRLLKNIPNMTDKPGEFKTKLNTFRKELEGAREDYLKNIGKQKKSAEKFQETAQDKQVSPQDKAAMEWLKANPDNPKAEAIRQKLKNKGVL